MKAVTVYEADDGTQFYTREECERYEKEAQRRAVLAQVPLWDDEGVRISCPDSWASWIEVGAFQVETKEQFEMINALMKENDLGTIPDQDEMFYEGLYYWDNKTGKWKNSFLELKRIRQIEAKFN